MAGELLCNADGELRYLNYRFEYPEYDEIYKTWGWKPKYDYGQLGSLLAKGDLPSEIWRHYVPPPGGGYGQAGYINQSKTFNLTGVSPLTEANIRAHIISQMRATDDIGTVGYWVMGFFGARAEFSYSGGSPSSVNTYFLAHAMCPSVGPYQLWPFFRDRPINRVMLEIGLDTDPGGNKYPEPSLAMPLRVGFAPLPWDWDETKRLLPTAISGLESLPYVDITDMGEKGDGVHLVDISALDIQLSEGDTLWTISWCANIMPPGKISGRDNRFSMDAFLYDFSILLDN